MKRAANRLKVVFMTASMAWILIACGSSTASPTTPSGTGSAASTVAPAPTSNTLASPTVAPAPTGNALASPAGGASLPTDAPAQSASAVPAPAATRLNLNEVTEDQLLSAIPNFSNRMVREFFEYRPYISIQQFRREIGKYVSAEQVAAYEQYVYVPIDVNAADAATLQQLPGVDATVAEALIAGRPYDSAQAFLAKLGTYIPADQAQLAASYLTN